MVVLGNITSGAIFARSCPEGTLGRVTAMRRTLTRGSVPLATLAGGAPQPDDPFADLLGPGSFGTPAPAPAARPPAASSPVDPLAGFGFSPSPPPADPFGFAAPAPAAARAAPAAVGGIPEDWDPFAPDPVAAKPAAGDLARSLGAPVIAVPVTWVVAKRIQATDPKDSL